MNKREAKLICHTLSNTSKMPCKSYSLPAVTACNVGGKLAKIPGSVCSGCYAAKGCYQWNSTQNAMAKRLAAIQHNEWVDAMATMIGNDKFFRWHDSGDIQSLTHLRKIVQVCNRTPNTAHWLPTKEKATVSAYLRIYGAFPENLTVRVSGAMIDGKPPAVPAGINTSTVHANNDPHGMACNAPANNGECGECRACWDKTVSNVSYLKH